MHLGLRADKEGRTAALRVIGGFACNEGFVFSLFYLGENRAFGDGPFAFERADLWGTLACMLIAFALLRMASPRARDALLSRPLVWCYAGLLVLGSLMPAIAGGGDHGIVLESLLVGLPAIRCRRCSCPRPSRQASACSRSRSPRPRRRSPSSCFRWEALSRCAGCCRRAPPQARGRPREAPCPSATSWRRRSSVTTRRGFRRRSSPVPCCSAWPQASWRRSAPIPAWLPRPRCWPACCCSCCSASHRCSFWA